MGELTGMEGYAEAVARLKDRIRQARRQAVATANTLLLRTYWEIGNTILRQQQEQGWGAKVIERLSQDLRMEFRDMKGLSPRNLKYMRAFAEAYPHLFSEEPPIVQPVVAQLVMQLPWSHNLVLLDRLGGTQLREFYARKCVDNQWSKQVLIHQIENRLHLRQGRAMTNFDDKLPPEESDLARETFRNPYVFDFLGITDRMREAELETALVNHIKSFLVELGRGFAYVGRQRLIQVGDQDFFLDLLFYNYHLHCFVVFELKLGEFKPEYMGQLSFYVTAVNRQIAGEGDKPTLGVLLCKEADRTVVQYTLDDMANPLGVAEYLTLDALPQGLNNLMPTIEELEQELEAEAQRHLAPSQERLGRIRQMVQELAQEEVRQGVSPATAQEVMQQAFLPLCDKVLERLEKDVAPLFPGQRVSYWHEIHGKDTREEFLHMVKERGLERGKLKLHIQLEGFRPAGTQAFAAWQEVTLNLEDDRYTVGCSSRQDLLAAKLYHLMPTQSEFAAWAEVVVDALLEQVENRLQQIKNEGA